MLDVRRDRLTLLSAFFGDAPSAAGTGCPVRTPTLFNPDRHASLPLASGQGPGRSGRGHASFPRQRHPVRVVHIRPAPGGTDRMVAVANLVYLHAAHPLFLLRHGQRRLPACPPRRRQRPSPERACCSEAYSGVSLKAITARTPAASSAPNSSSRADWVSTSDAMPGPARRCERKCPSRRALPSFCTLHRASR